MTTAKGQFVRLKPCAEHETRARHVPRCFHNWGGVYEIIRQIRGGKLLLQHLDTNNKGYATYDDIITGG